MKLKEVTGRQIMEWFGSMGPLVNTKLSAKLSRRVLYNWDKIAAEMDSLQKERNKVIEKYGGTATTPVPETNKAAAEIEINEMLDDTVDIDLRDVVLPEDCPIEPAVLINCRAFVTVDGEDNEPERGGVQGDGSLAAYQARRKERLDAIHVVKGKDSPEPAEEEDKAPKAPVEA
jgi:hypothetical protein